MYIFWIHSGVAWTVAVVNFLSVDWDELKFDLRQGFNPLRHGLWAVLILLTSFGIFGFFFTKALLFSAGFGRDVVSRENNYWLNFTE